MSKFGVSYLWTLLLTNMLLVAASIKAIPSDSKASASVIQDIDTSEYLPAFYPGAINYNLMIASLKGYPSEIDRLIKMGAEVDAENSEGETAIFFAVAGNQTKSVKTLLKYNPSLDLITNSNDSPLLIAVKNRNFEITEILIRAGATVDYSGKEKVTPLTYASIYGYPEITDMLLYYDADIEARANDGTTPLIASVFEGFVEVTDLLIKNGADIECRDNEGNTPFMIAASNGDTLIMNILYKQGANIYSVNNWGHNALVLSIVSNKPWATELLLQMGNKWSDIKNGQADPYKVALHYRRNNIINLLAKYGIHGQKQHSIDQISLSLSSRFSRHDFYTGIGIYFEDSKLNGGFVAGCDTKLWHTRVLIKESENTYYQYMDKGYIAYAGFYKNFELSDLPQNFKLSLSSSILMGYSFGNKLKGTLISPKEKVIAIPSVSLHLSKQNFSTALGLEYLKTDFYKDGTIWFRLGVSYSYNFDNFKPHLKTINWD